MSDRDELIKRLRKTFTTLLPDTAQLEAPRMDFLQTGILPYDLALGGGFPRGNITHIYGPDGGGKTTSMIPIIRSAQKNHMVNGVTLYIANEPKVDESMFYRLGVDPRQVIFVKTREAANPLDGNKAMNMVREALGQVELIIVDSVAGLSPGVIYDMNSEDYAIGKVAALLSSQLPLIANILAATKTVLVLLNQQRASFSQYGKEVKPFAGHALAHWVAARVWMRSSGWIKSGSEFTGFKPKITVEKNDFHPPKKEAVWHMDFETGVDEVQAAFDCAKELGVVTTSGGYAKLGEESLNHPGEKGQMDALARLKAEPELLNQLNDSVWSALEVA